jgi:L-lactate utilization protein LutB
MKTWNDIPDDATIERVRTALAANGFEAFTVKDGAEAVSKVLSLIPEGTETFTMPSATLDSIGLVKAVNESGKYDSVRAKLVSMDAAKQGREMRKLGAGPDVSIGSVHAVTEGGSLVIASLTGSQLPAYAYGAGTAIFVVGVNKVVKNLDEASKRLEERVVPMESARARKAYGLPDSFNSKPNKVLTINGEAQPGRIKVVLVKEALGF